MYAIVRIGGKQYRAELGGTLVVEKLPHEVGEHLDFNEVLLFSDGEITQVGRPLVQGISVGADVINQFRGKKIVVFKFKPKIRYRRKQGHRQSYTRLLVTNIGGKQAEKKAPLPASATRRARPAAEAAASETETVEPPRAKKTQAQDKTEASAKTTRATRTSKAKKQSEPADES